MSAKAKSPTLEIVIKSVRNKRKSISIEWTQGTDDYAVNFHDNPLPSFYKALDGLKPHVVSLCEFGKNDVEKIVATGITVRESGENQLALIVAKKTIKKGKRVFNIATPLLPMYEGEKEGDKAIDFMEEEQASAIEKVIAEAKKYVQGERAQGQIEFKDEGDDDGKTKGDKTTPFPGMDPGDQT